MEENIQIKYKTSKFLLLLNLITIVAIGGVAYLTLYGKTDLMSQIKINHVQGRQIQDLEQKNILLSVEISKLKNEQKKLEQSVAQLSPSKTGIILSQVNSLISSANQSVILYHNINSAIRLLNTAQQTLMVSNDPLFDNLKVSLTHDINNLTGQNQYDTTILQTQVGDLTKYIYALTDTNSKQENQMVIEYNGSKWNNFKDNITETLRGLFSNNQQKNSLTNIDNIKNTEILIQLSLNVKQAMFMYNQEAWNKNLVSIKDIISINYMNNIEGQKILELVKSLGNVNFNNGNNSLDETIQALSKTNQLYGN